MQTIDLGTESSERADGAFFSSISRSTHFILLRHGQSEGNARRIVQGRMDLALDDFGRSQARAVAPWIAERRPDLIIASPLKRAAETAAIIAAEASISRSEALEPRHSALFAELDVGPFEGLRLDEAATRFPEASAAFRRLSWDGVPGAETSTQLYRRAIEAWTFLKAEARSGAACILVVTHGGFIQWLIKATMGVRNWMPLVTTSNCGISEFEVAPHKTGEDPLVLWNSIDYRAPGVDIRVTPVF